MGKIPGAVSAMLHVLHIDYIYSLACTKCYTLKKKKKMRPVLSSLQTIKNKLNSK